MNFIFNQLAGALGLLKMNDVELPYADISEKLRAIARENGPYDCDTDEVRSMHRRYRDMCLMRGLISIGELFNLHDATPII